MFLAAGLAGALSATAPLSPTGKWAIDYASDRCTLQRTFGSGQASFTLRIRTQPGVATVDLVQQGGAPTKVAVSGEVRVALFPTEAAVHAPLERAASPDGELIAKLSRDVLDAFPGAARIDIDIDRSVSVSLMMNAGESALAAVKACEDNLLASWGVDPRRFRPIIPLGKPGFVDPFRSSSALASSYPSDAIRAHAEGRVLTLLRIDAGGKATGCRAINSSGNASLDQQTCALAAYARFPTWNDQNGRVAPYWTVFQMRWVLPAD